MQKDLNRESEYLNNAVQFFTILVKNINTVFWVTFLCTVSMIVFVLVVPPKYKADVVVLPSSSKSSGAMGMMSSLISGFLSNNQSNDGVYSTFYFPHFIKSRRILEPVLFYEVEQGNGKGKIKVFEFLEDDQYDTLQLLDHLQDLVSGETNFETGILKISVTTKNPYISSGIANAIARELDDYNNTNRRVTSSRLLSDINLRLDDAYDLYMKAQGDYTVYLSKHRAGNLSPEAEAEKSNLQSKVDIYRDNYVALITQREMLNNEVARNTPVLTVLDSAYVDFEKEYPKRKRMVVTTFIISLILSIVFVGVKSIVEESSDSINAAWKTELIESIKNVPKKIWRIPKK